MYGGVYQRNACHSHRTARRNRSVQPPRLKRQRIQSTLRGHKTLVADNATHITSNRKLSPMATTTTYDLKFVGNPATNAARLKALAHGGPLVVALDHRLTAMMPDAFDDAPGGGKTVHMADLVPVSYTHLTLPTILLV